MDVLVSSTVSFDTSIKGEWRMRYKRYGNWESFTEKFLTFCTEALLYMALY